MSSTISSFKQRKLNDLRVVDLHRELRFFNVAFDKKELKGSLLEKLRQALISRNLDPDNYSFDASTDLKSISSDEMNRSHEDNGLNEMNNSDTLNVEVDFKQQQISENPVQTNTLAITTATTTPMSSLIMDADDEQINPMDTISLKEIVDNNEFSIVHRDDGTSDDKRDQSFTQASCSSSDDEFNTNNFIQQTTDTEAFEHDTESVSAIEQQISSDSQHGEAVQHSMSTTNLQTDNDNLLKSETDRQQSFNEQHRKESTNKSSKDNCFLWVSNIAKETRASDLNSLFSKHGKVLAVKVIGSSSSQWFGYISLTTQDDVEKCIHALHKTELHGKRIIVDREMHDPMLDSSSKSRSADSSTTSSSSSSVHHRKSSSVEKKRSDQPNRSSHSHDLDVDMQEKSTTRETNVRPNKRPASTSNENKRKLLSSEINRPFDDHRNVRLHEASSTYKRSNEFPHENQRISSNADNNQSSRYYASRSDLPKTVEKTESSHKLAPNDYKNDRRDMRLEKSSTTTSYLSKSRSSSHRSQSIEKHFIPSTTENSNSRHRSSSIDRSKACVPSSSYTGLNKYDRPKESFSKDNTYRATSSRTFDTDRRSSYQSEERYRHEKETFARKQYVQQQQKQEEENIKEQQRRLAEERERMRREFEILERERLEIERTRLALEKEKQDQARELEKQQRRLADEAKHRQQQAEAKLRDEKLHRLSHNDNKRSRSSHYEPQRSHHTNPNDSNNSNKGYDHRTTATSGRGRNRSHDVNDRDYYPEPKRQYTNNANNQREAIFRDRAVYHESDLPSSSSISSSSSNTRRLSDPYKTHLPPRGRDTALPPTSSVSTAYERSSRSVTSPTTNTNPILRRPHSRERFDDREYISQATRRDRSSPTNSALRRESLETTHWERPKPRDTSHYVEDTHKYLSNQYISNSTQSNQQQQQGLWSAAPPSRQQHHHSDIPLKTTSHAPVVESYGWPHVSQQAPSGLHHPATSSSSHDRSRSNVSSNQRIPILSSNQPPPPPPPPSSRSNSTGQTHLYSHPGVPVNSLPPSQQHVPLTAPPPSLHHAAAYVTQQAPPTGLVLHPTSQARAYEQHYVVTQPLSQRRY